MYRRMSSQVTFKTFFLENFLVTIATHDVSVQKSMRIVTTSFCHVTHCCIVLELKGLQMFKPFVDLVRHAECALLCVVYVCSYMRSYTCSFLYFYYCALQLHNTGTLVVYATFALGKHPMQAFPLHNVIHKSHTQRLCM